MDKIIIKDLRIFAYHGVNDDEKEKGQPFEMDITCFVDLTKPCVSDDVEDTVSYAKIIKTVRESFCEQRYDLIEKAAQSVADSILCKYSQIQRADILLKKPRAPILADFTYVAVEISRKQEGYNG